jgi:chromosome partitioning protein
VIEPPIPKTVRFAEAPGRGVSILEHAPNSSGAQAYRAIAAALHRDLIAGAP